MPMLRRALVRAIRFHGTFYTGKRIFQIPFMQFETADSNLYPAAGPQSCFPEDILCDSLRSLTCNVRTWTHPPRLVQSLYADLLFGRS
ncbi:hypothetical protein MPTK1_3g22480 [Marchantia polymorpha subsp. ruderalis]|uniref:Uncharacterized protein n=2 Tax=Marchantia polymorpha TaxID=3197 RepID=A0AAF6B3M2_MARPO|nr:hypothetical protein MARPO_0024s0026 [Marchantia polymorpha]PTQ43507.1 hypothetical protein MARPO_0024s0026 [Marchantia polymorpha]BBN06606.1 hypothetical protein Mp_3g22480 [Marchantia polymorpha subsp. ruderalis]BBN06607.1 hypothetical protein Mp_3g22480 [Marchantia polymorpha subsp. ruderalis]|eukprot:PTQ43506.1 hypothetical protein MARPO_0024s0026 [Marchantia polymorpha]